MRVSIVVTNHNYEAFVAEAIDSALAQTLADVEVVVVDDGSVDGSRAVAESYGNRIQLVPKANGGQASAVNAGFAAATGDAVIFLDADDTLFPSAAATVARCFEDTAVVKVHWPLHVVDEVGSRIGGCFPSASLAQGDLRPRLRTGTDHVTPPQSGNAYRRAFLEEVLPMPEAPFRTGADTYLFLLAQAFGRLAAVPPQGTYRRHAANNFSGRRFDDRMAQLRAWTEASHRALERHCQRLGVPADPAAWRRNAWVHRVSAAVRCLDEVIGDRPYVLVDEGEWALTDDAARRALPFLERDGAYWGPPSDDRMAIRELERMRARGAGFIAFAPVAFWWFEHFAGLRAHLEEHYQVVSRTDDLVVYDLSGR